MNIITSVLDLLFPPKCVFCSRILNHKDDGWCDKCTESLPWADNSGRQSGENFETCISPLYYRGVVRKSILRYKFRDAQAYAKTYGKMLAESINENPDIVYDIITWVPLSKKHEQTRGYDQAKLLAIETAKELSEIAIETLKKPKDIKSQSELGNKEERIANITDAYEPTNQGQIIGKNILLIDDITTTGSTLDECAKTLLQAGASRVQCATLACGE